MNWLIVILNLIQDRMVEQQRSKMSDTDRPRPSTRLSGMRLVGKKDGS
jgi:hypothetical protein